MGTAVSASGNGSFCKWERQFPQVGTAVSASGNGSFRKREREQLQVGHVEPYLFLIQPYTFRFLTGSYIKIEFYCKLKTRIVNIATNCLLFKIHFILLQADLMILLDY